MKKLSLYLFGLLNIVIILFFWWQGSSFLVQAGDSSSLMIAFGRLFGLFGQAAILVQLILIGRVVWIEREFGHDKMNKLHRTLGYSIAFFFFFHPFLLVWGYSAQNHVSFASQFATFLSTWQDVFAAFAAFVIFTGVIILALPAVQKRLKYEHWYFTHLFIYLAIVLVFSHQINTADVASGLALYYWLALNFGIGALYVAYRCIRPWYRFYKHQFYIDKVVQETSDVYSVYIRGRYMEEFTFEAGQFANYTFLQKGMWYTHPFSFSSAFNGEYIRISIKGVGDFTKRISELRPGTKVVIDGPLGIFTEKSSHKNKYLLIAGGIGITPVRSLAESLVGEDKDVTILYGTRSKKDIAFREELENMPHKNHYVISEILEVPDSVFEQGYVDAEKIKRLVPDFMDREIYICGPVVMMNSVISLFERFGVPQKQVHFEKFGY